MRLFNTHRNKIKRAVLEHIYLPLEMKLREDGTRLAEKVYAAVVGPHVAAMQKMPSWFFGRSAGVTLMGAGGKWLGDYQLEEVRIVPDEGDSGESHLRLDDFPDLQAEVEAFCLQREQQAEMKAKALRQLEAVLRSVTTLEQLRKMWPEGRTLLPEDWDAHLPVSVDIKTLNSMLGLGTPTSSVS